MPSEFSKPTPTESELTALVNQQLVRNAEYSNAPKSTNDHFAHQSVPDLKTTLAAKIADQLASRC